MHMMQSNKGGGGPLQMIMDKVLCWNVRGITSVQKQNEVKKVLNTRSLQLISLVETKVKVNKMGVMYQNLFPG